MSFLLKIVFAGISSVIFAGLFNVRPQNRLLAGICGLAGYAVYLAVNPSMPGAGAVFAAASLMAALSEILARIRKTPVTSFLIAGIIPIVPGGGLYYTMLELMRGEMDTALATGFDTFLQFGAIAVGILTVSSAVKIVRGVQKIRRRGAGPNDTCPR